MKTFVDLSKFISKAGLLHIRNIQPSIPTVYFVHMKETYENTDLLLKALRYSKCEWKICGDIKLYAPRVLYVGQAFRYSPEEAFYIFNQQIYFII